MQFVGADQNAELLGEGATAGTVNHLEGTDPSRWITGVPTYRSVRARGVWPGVDVVYHGGATGIEYDLIVHPQPHVPMLRVRFRGARHIRLDPNGELLLETAAGEIRQHRPITYQETEAGRIRIETSYILHGDTVSFRLGAFDRRRPVVIDPVLDYATRLSEGVSAVAVDAQGNAYLAASLGGVVVTKISSDGTKVLYQTYIGANQANAIAVDSAGNAYICGITSELDTSFPITPGALQTTNPAGAAYVLKLDPTGTKVVYGTYLGGGFTTCEGLAVDQSGNAFVAGRTAAYFPTTAGAFQPVFRGTNPDFQVHAYVAKLNATGTGLIYSTFLEGSGSERAESLVVDANGDAYVAGSTSSTDFPTTPGVLGPGPISGGYGFLARLNPSGTALVYSTYLPTGDVPSLAVDPAGNAYFSSSSAPGGLRDAVVKKVDPSGTKILYSTTFGGTQDDVANAIAVDSKGTVYVTGATLSLNFPVTPDGVQACGLIRAGYGDAFVAQLDPSGSLVSATYLGGSGDDAATAIALDTTGGVYIAGSTNSTDGSFATALMPGQGGGAYGAFLAKMSFVPRNLPPVTVSCVGHAASLTPSPVAPGEIVSIFGFGLGPSAPVLGQFSDSGVLMSSLAGTQALFDGVAAPLLYVQDRQINAVVPYEVTGKTNVTVQVISNGTKSQALTLPVLPANPAIFSLSFTGVGQGVIFNEDGTLNSDSNPAMKGSVITLYGTGIGQTVPPSVDGTITQSPVPALATQPEVIFGSFALDGTGHLISPQGEVVSAGPAPFYISGLFQISVRVPEQANSGDVPIQIFFPGLPIMGDARVTAAIE